MMLDLKNFPKVISSERVELRFMEPTFENAQKLFKLVDETRDMLGAWTNSNPDNYIKTPEEAFVFLVSANNSWNQKRSLRFGIFSGDELIGTIFANDISLNNSSFSVGVFISKLEFGKGYATDALYLLLKEMFAHGFNRASFRCDFDNERSAKLAIRTGFIQEGLLRQMIWDDARNEFVDKLIFSMLKEDWEKNNPIG